MTNAQFLKDNLRPGEEYAGIILDPKGDYHVFLLPGYVEGVTWAQAKEFAKKAGGELPTRREQSLLFANLKECFQERWYWSSEQHASGSDYAWYQYFGNGTPGYNHKSGSYRARAVRRVSI